MHFAAPPDEERIRAQVELVAGDAVAQTLIFDTIAARDWVEASLEGLAPVPAGRFIVHGRHDRARVPPNKLGIEIEAALAFGTGHHGTTRGCLLLLDQVLRSKMPRRVLDLGAGTGVLAIAAAKALRRKVLASDIDLRSTIVANENAALNGVGDLVWSICASGFSAPPFRARAPFDLVLANILANPLRQMAPVMATHLASERAGQRHRSAFGDRGERERRAERRRRSCLVDLRDRLFRAAVSGARAVRSGAGEHSRQSAAADGAGHGNSPCI
jgi:ribosomal protein L11 methyltransferase